MEYHSGGSLPLLGRPRYCPGANANGGYLCETGHCCGETGCCTYYYELWWFWLLWTVLILFSCCCAYRHRRAKQRVQQQQRQREISLLAYHGASSYPSSMLDLSFLASLKLPSYEEVAAQPSTPPPPYSSVFTTPRYPQPPRTADPHLLTQHDPLLHRPLSDGPSSLSSDNSSSCSCDSCCPSSPCSSSLSAPVTYETDTSHATTPSEATPLALDVTMETISAAATCLEGNEARCVCERMVAAVTVGVDEEDAAGASPHPLPSPSSDQSLPVVTPHKVTSMSGPSTPASTPTPQTPQTPQTPDLTRTLDVTSVPSSPALVRSPDVGRMLAPMTCSAGLPNPDSNSSPEPVPLTLIQAPDPVPPSLTQVTTSQAKPTIVPDPVLTPEPAHLNCTVATGAGPGSPALPPCRTLDLSPGLALGPTSLRSGSPQHSESCSESPAAPAASGPGLHLVPSQSAEVDLISPLPSNVQAGFGSGSGSCSSDGSRSGALSAPAPVLTFPTPAASSSSCPSITIEPDSSLAPSQSPPASPAPPAPPAVLSSPPAPALLLDPLTALQSHKGGSSSGHASSLSPSPRATQSPPKQTLFSPCVDVFEPGPPSWEDEEEEQEEEDNDDYEDEDMGADESQYRHRRLTGDSGIEVCRCQVEEEEEEGGGGKEDGRRGGDKKGDGNTDLHDSADCPARGQTTTGEELTLCGSSPSTPGTEDSDKVIIVMETV